MTTYIAEQIDYTKYLPVKTVTIREVYEAIEKNGFNHLREEWVRTTKSGKVIAGCVLGQAAVNLGVLPNESLINREHIFESYPKLQFENELDRVNYRDFNELPTPLLNFIFKYSLISQLDNVHAGLGSDLVDRNDAERYTSGGRKVFTYSWKEVVAYAKERLEPYFNKKITLIEWTPNTFPSVWRF